MRNFKLYILTIFLVVAACLFTTGCTNDSMDNIDIVVTNYPTQFIQMALILQIIKSVISKRMIMQKWIYLFITDY